ncbi:hypothetical protein LG634_01050 [Streptomyces bambusae]|uniref:hypothetical protein n=1 Tax=Streptomyces bambusae TaxID=1550616 RepID=UPI001CFD826E|nr:hypothetical protein [Streptomyces bambusae]MCB5163440.1 hypothetical protein [Streptomyces bambusae]
MPFDPYAALNAMLRAEASRIAPRPQTPPARPQAVPAAEADARQPERATAAAPARRPERTASAQEPRDCA